MWIRLALQARLGPSCRNVSAKHRSPSAIKIVGACDLMFLSGATASPLYHNHPHQDHEHVHPHSIEDQTRNAMDAITIGKSTRADVIATLGKTTIISFDSGFEVWVYQFKADTPTATSWAERFGFARSDKGKSGNSELVVLFEQSGIVTKARLRDTPLPGDAKER